MNKRQKKKQAKKIELFGAYYVDSYRTLKAATRLYHEYSVEDKKRFRKYEHCEACRNVLYCEKCFDMTMCEIENCEDFEAEPTSKRLEDMRACAEGVE